MKKFKWPWSGKKKAVKRAPIDLSEYEEFWKKMQETFYHLRGSGL
jgi:hypothetical protein